MVCNNSPISLLREGYYEGDLARQIFRYSSDFISAPSLVDSKYGLYVPEEPSLVLVSRLSNGFSLSAERINFYVAFTSYSEELIKDRIKDFQEKTRIHLSRHEHPNLRKLEKIIPKLFEQVIVHGPESMWK